MKLPLALSCCGVIVFVGCTSWLDGRNIHSPTADDEDSPTVKKTRLVGDVAVPYNTHVVRVEAVGLVSNLPGTGSDPAPCPQRAALLAEMQTRGVQAPTAVLESKNVSLVMVQAYLRAGIQKGDRVDVEVRVPARSETTSLRGGYLLPTRLLELAVLPDNQIHQGHVLGDAEGPILVNPTAEGEKDRVALCRGRVLGSCVVRQSRPLALVIPDSTNQHLAPLQQIIDAINKRFHFMHKGAQVGVAKGIKKEYIELTVHPRYKDNIERYMNVVRAIALRESPAEQAERLDRLKTRLFKPAVAGNTALQLEAIGRDAIPVLREGMKSGDVEVQFYSAEALAYLDQREAAEALGDVARREPAFRVFALTALSAMNDRSAYDQLYGMLGLPSAETRYGAFRALWAMDGNNPLVLGDPEIHDFHFSIVDAGGPPMVHVTHSRRPEIVLFGKDLQLQGHVELNAGPKIMVTSTSSGEVSAARFVPGEPDQKRLVSPRVSEVIHAIVDLGGTYPDVLQALEEAKATGVLPARFEVDALPEGGRTFDRGVTHSDSTGDHDKSGSASGSSRPMPIPSLFSTSDAGKLEKSEADDAPKEEPDSKADSEKKSSSGGFLGKIMGRD